MKQKSLPPFLVVFGAGVVVVASLGFVLASLGAGAGRSAATPFSPTQMPVATSVPNPLPTPASAVGPISLLPTPPPVETLKVAPDFALEQADGGAFTLSDQLVQGPVVLVFFQKCG